MHYLITGHTGFKGAWLAWMLLDAGHTVSGLSLPPEPGALSTTTRLGERLAHDLTVDIRDREATADGIARVAPDVVLHLAAQPLVRRSYADPVETIESNVVGTMNVLEAVRRVPSVKSHVVITTDKVYRNVERALGYREDEPLGGNDPYSASKAMADILTQSWIRSFEGPPTAIARAGNVIGGGDVSPDRLLPDILTAVAEQRDVLLRFPGSVRPWQHVLDCLNGYLALTDALLAGRGLGEWNFGPGEESFVEVAAVTEAAIKMWPSATSWRLVDGPQPHEATLLALDASKAEQDLGWRNVLPYPECLEWTVSWQREVLAGGDPRAVTLAQIRDFRNRLTELR